MSYWKETPGKLEHLKEGLLKYVTVYQQQEQNWTVSSFSKQPFKKTFSMTFNLYLL